MNFRDLIHECHRRSLWQVLGIYVVGSWIVFEVVQTLTEGLGLPDWFPGFAFALLLIGLPIVMATAFVQEGGPSGDSPEVAAPSAATEAGEVRGSLLAGLLTWGNAIRGGVGALALWGVVAAGWLLLGRGTQDSFQASGAVPIRSVAVLPFANMSDEDANEHFADGLAEELLNVLAKVEDLKVAARTSAFAFKGQDAGIREIGETLGVEAVVEGSVRKQRDRVRITAQLVQVSDGFHLWSDTYDGDLADVFALQDSVARAIAGALQVTLGIEGRSRRERGLTDDLDAYELYLLGRHHWAQRSDAASLRRIREYYERAADADPEFALAYSGLADVQLVTPLYDVAADRAGSHRRAREAAARAVQLSPDEPEVQATAGYTAFWADWDLARAARHLDRAVALGPSYVWGYHYRSVLRRSQGRWRAALRDERRALELDPLSPVVAASVGSILRGLDSLEAALPLLERAARSSQPAHHWLRDHAMVLGMLGRATECGEAWVDWARAHGYPELDRVRRLWAAYPRWSRPDAMTLDAWADDEALRAWAEEWELLLDDLVERTEAGVGDDVAYAYFLAGPNRFLEVAETQVEERSLWALFLNRPDFYSALQGDPRYQALLERVGLPPPEGP